MYPPRLGAGDLQLPSQQLHQEQRDEPLQPTRCPGFDREEIGGHDQIPVFASETPSFPFSLGAGSIPLRANISAVVPQPTL